MTQRDDVHALVTSRLADVRGWERLADDVLAMIQTMVKDGRRYTSTQVLHSVAAFTGYARGHRSQAEAAF